jgi:uncharacterized protein YggU (UPF0235/DUF167 family)
MFIKLKVFPDAKINRCIKKTEDTYIVHVQEPAKQGLANAAALRMLASTMTIARGRLYIVKGAHSPNKIVGIRP